MSTCLQLVGRTVVGLFLAVTAASCSLFGPDLAIDIQNEGPKRVTVTFDSSAPGRTDREEVIVILRGHGVGWSQPLPSTWEVRIDGNHVIGSGDRSGALPSSGQQQDVTFSIRIDPDGTVRLLDAR
jgi:hypothetical protein